LSGTVKRISVVIFVQDLPREQFVFDITQLSQKRLDTAGKHVITHPKSRPINQFFTIGYTWHVSFALNGFDV
jgi:hypothetical protein